jgi:hypothetical protein
MKAMVVENCGLVWVQVEGPAFTLFFSHPGDTLFL